MTGLMSIWARSPSTMTIFTGAISIAARLAIDLSPIAPLALHALGNKSNLAGDPREIARM